MGGVPLLYLVIPCYNEEQVLPLTSKIFLEKISSLAEKKKISGQSKILFVNDGSTDSTWEIIKNLCSQSSHFAGVSLSRNRGHQNALLAGLFVAMEKCDITISIDCDGQDDIDACDKMVEEYLAGNEVVYGVRSSRKSDKFFKRFTAETFYKLLSSMGVEVVFNHADYRLMSSRVIQEFMKFKEVNLFLRGMVPLVGFKNSKVYYERHERLAGKSHYPLRKMLALAFNGITSLSIKPIRIISFIGILFSLLSFAGIIYALVSYIIGRAVSGWASMTSLICFLGGIQLVSLGVIGEYIGKIYLESKERPRFIIEEYAGFNKGE
jgi:glycosyltransferase involved in cell wall biosynthesis